MFLRVVAIRHHRGQAIAIGGTYLNTDALMILHGRRAKGGRRRKVPLKSSGYGTVYLTPFADRSALALLQSLQRFSNSSGEANGDRSDQSREMHEVYTVYILGDDERNRAAIQPATFAYALQRRSTPTLVRWDPY
jgi:hypothetical protein